MAGSRITYVGATFYDTFPVFAPGATGGKISGFTAIAFQQYEFWNGQAIPFQPTIYEATGTGQYFIYLPNGFPSAGAYAVQVIDPVGEVWESDVDVYPESLQNTILDATLAGHVATGTVGGALSAVPGIFQSAQLSFTYNPTTNLLIGNCWLESNGQLNTMAASAVVNVYNNLGVLVGNVSIPTIDAQGVFDFTVPNLTITLGQLLYVQAIITPATGPVVSSIKGIQVL
jgi:hypothetical protein